MNEQEDPILEGLKKAVEDMEKRDKTGLSMVDIMRPQQMLFNYLRAKMAYDVEQSVRQEHLSSLREKSNFGMS